MEYYILANGFDMASIWQMANGYGFAISHIEAIAICH